MNPKRGPGIFQRTLLRVARLLLAVLLAGRAFGVQPPPQHAAGQDLVPVTLQLKWRHQFQFAGYYAAIAQGYYREAGLDVRLVEAEPGTNPVDAVLRGEAQFGVGTSELVLSRAKGAPVVVLATIFQHSPLVLIARGSGAETDLQSLGDRPMMIEPQSAELFAYFRDEGVDPARLNIVPHTFRVEDLLNGTVGAMSGYSTDEPFVLQRSGVPFSVFSPRAGGIDFYGDNLFTSEAVLRAQPAMVKAFLDASLRGWEYALAHREEIIELILTRYRPEKSREHLRFEAERTAQLIHPELIEVGHLNPGRWRHIADTYAALGMLPRGFDVAPMLYDSDPRPDLRRWYWALGITAAVAAAALGWIVPLVRLNRRLRRSERQYRELAENAPFPVIISDIATARVVFANRLAGEMFGGAPDALTGRRALDYYEDPADRERLLADLEAGKAAPREIRLRTLDGREFWTLLSAARVGFDGHSGIVVAFNDITARIAMQDELRRAKDAAEQANAARNRYLGVMSHEIRTPLGGILGLTDLMLDDGVPLNAEQRENLESVNVAAQNLLRLVNEMLDWSQLEDGAMRMDSQPVVLADFLRHLLGLYRPATEARGVGLDLEISPAIPQAVLTDPLRLRQILSNLVSNAVKFTERGSVHVTLDGTRLADGGWRLRFAVADTGPGIGPEVQAKLFEPFVQGDAAVARQYGGSGLGLSIGRRLARLLGGDITLRSTPGEGSTFTVEITAAEAPA